jgi:hypothetical protein
MSVNVIERNGSDCKYGEIFTHRVGSTGAMSRRTIFLIIIIINNRTRDSSVGIATGYGLEDQGSNPGRSKIFLFSTAPRPALRHTQLHMQWVPGAFTLVIKRPGREADH